MSAFFLILIAIFIFTACFIGLKRIKGNAPAKIILGVILGFIVIWLVWLMIMVFAVGPTMKNM